MNQEELAGVLAHELGHVKNHDTLLMTITATIAGAISMLANFGFYFGGRSNDNNNIGFIGSLLAAHSRAARRRAGADGDQPHARIRGRPRGRRDQRQPLSLASALQKIAGAAQHIPNMPAERNPASAHLFIVNPLSGARMDNLFSTHPNVENRVAPLQEIAREMGESGPPASAPEDAAGPWSAPQRRLRDAGLGARP